MFLTNFFKARKEFQDFISEIDKRTEHQWISSWGGTPSPLIRETCRLIQQEMGLPSFYLLPNDPLRLVFFNRTNDMREITALTSTSDLVGVDLTGYRDMAMRDLFLESSQSHA